LFGSRLLRIKIAGQNMPKPRGSFSEWSPNSSSKISPSSSGCWSLCNYHRAAASARASLTTATCGGATQTMANRRQESFESQASYARAQSREQNPQGSALALRCNLRYINETHFSDPKGFC